MSGTRADKILEAADALTEPSLHVVMIPYWENRNRKARRYETIMPGLLQQVYASVLPAGGGEALVGGLPGSRPPLAVEALSLHDEICMAVLAWCTELKLSMRVSVESNIRALVGALGHMDVDQTAALLADLIRWRHWCAVFAGWERIYRPSGVPCMISGCEKVNTLRINLTAKTGLCRSCGAVWDEGSIGVLAEHVRTFDHRVRVAA